MAEIVTIPVTIRFESVAEFRANNWNDDQWHEFEKNIPKVGLAWNQKVIDLLKEGRSAAILFAALQNDDFKLVFLNEAKGQVNFELYIRKTISSLFEELLRSGKAKDNLQKVLNSMYAEKPDIFPGKSILKVTHLLSPTLSFDVQKEHLKQICSIVDNEFTVNHESIESIFGQPGVKDSPIAVLSIIGQMRTGKSFLLSLLADYFAKLEICEEENWRTNLNGKLNSLFRWKSGVVAQTKGIWISTKPFWINVAENEKIALFLMDSQGLFDTVDTNEEMAKLFAMTTVLSSYEIFNVKGQLTSIHLQALQKLSKYADIFYDPGIKFESLLILLRDWNGRKTGYGFKAGEDYMKSQLNPTEMSKENRAASKQFLSSFSSYGCYALPEPSDDIRNSEDEDMGEYTKKDIGEHFLKEVEHLFKSVSQRLTTRKYGSKVMKGSDMSALVNNCAKKMSLSDAAVEQSLIEGKKEHDVSTLMTTTLQKFANSLKEKLTNAKKQHKTLDRKTIENIQKSCTTESIIQFETALVLKDPKQLEEKSKIFRDLLKSHMSLIIDATESEKRLSNHPMVYNGRFKYNLAMEKILEEKHATNLFAVHSKCKESVVNDVSKQIEGRGDKQEILMMLDDEIEKSYHGQWIRHNAIHCRIYSRPVVLDIVDLSLISSYFTSYAGLLGTAILGVLFPQLFVVDALMVFSGVNLGSAALMGVKTIWRWFTS